MIVSKQHNCSNNIFGLRETYNWRRFADERRWRWDGVEVEEEGVIEVEEEMEKDRNRNRSGVIVVRKTRCRYRLGCSLV